MVNKMYVISVLIVACFMWICFAQNPCTTPNGEAGHCISFYKCEPFVKAWHSRSHKNIKFFRASHCGFRLTTPLVCCGTTAEYTNKSTHDSPKIETTTTEKIEIYTSPNVVTEMRTPLPISIPTVQTLWTSDPIDYTSNPIQTLFTNSVLNSIPLKTTTDPPNLYTSATVTETSSSITTKRTIDMKTKDDSNGTKYDNHPNIGLIPKDEKCGVQSTRNKIFSKNNKTEIDEFPWMALLFYDVNLDGNISNQCGGSLINERYVLTAAHCILGKNLVSVRLGEYNIQTEKDCVLIDDNLDCASPYQDFQVEETIVFQKYSNWDKRKWNDIALIRLSRNAKFNDFVKPICLPMRDERSLPGDLLTVSGWGLTEEDIYSPVKLKVIVPTWSQVSCQEIYSIGYGITVSDQQFCAGGKTNEDSCTGDSGGPAMRIFPNGSNYYIEGIVSFGPKPCGRQATPGIYVRVSEYIDWILDNLKPF